MRGLIASEWIKLRSVRSSWVLVGIAAVFPLLVTILYTSIASEPSADSLFRALNAASLVTFILLGVLGVTAITTEYGVNTIRPTFATTPRRAQVVVAKALVLVALALVVQLVTVVGGLEIAALVASGRDLDLGLGDLDGLVPAATGQVLFGPGMALLGLSFGLVLRATAAGVALLILWPLVIESVIGGMLSLVGAEDVASWLPYQAGATMHALAPEGDPGRFAGGLIFAAFLGAVLVAGTAIVSRRDA
jgi:ABC-2 type transport system permease protein